MIQTIEAIIDGSGQIQLAEPLRLRGTHRALVTILDEAPTDTIETTLLSESGLADWSRSEEDDAWSHLQ